MSDTQESGTIDKFIEKMVQDLKGIGYHIGIMRSTMPVHNENILQITEAVVVRIPKEESSGVEAKASEAEAGDGEG